MNIMKQQVEKYGVQKVSIAAVIVLIVAFMLYNLISNQMYKSDLFKAMDQMEIGIKKAEVMVDQYEEVWNGAIESDYGYEMDNGETAWDFDEAINMQYDIFKEDGNLKELESIREVVRDTMKDLRNPPSKYEKAYTHVVSMYAHFISYAKLGEEPKGSYQTYSEKTDTHLGYYDTEKDKLKAVID
ncbi:hypothetical protein [Peribacillus kribbensis]|uniref:hypothetical protein n=1 Tax=Peribacillus kribbensis TaxID=356658 RepID=UPI000426D5C6|nr:hypothetical protein [Peribacillus kribbensis]